MGKESKKITVTELFGLTIGQLVVVEIHHPGGYGRIYFTQGKVVKLNPKRCRVELEKRDGEKKQVSISYANIKESTQYQ